MAELVAVRHGESTAKAALATAQAAGREDSGLDHRDADVALTALGRAQAVALGRRLATRTADRRLDVVVCSPYRRARDTAVTILEHLRRDVDGPLVRVDERLRDREFGVLELLTPTGMQLRHPTEAVRRQRVGEFYYRPRALALTSCGKADPGGPGG